MFRFFKNYVRVYVIAVITAAVVLTSCSGKEQSTLPKVQTAGKASNVMTGTDFDVHLDLDSLWSEPALFGLGPLEDLRGEITVLNGIPYVTTLHNGKLTTEIDSAAKAPFFVYASAPRMNREKHDVQFQSLNDIEDFTADLSAENGFDPREAFPFLIEGTFDQVDIHVINLNSNEENISHKAHKKAKQKFTYRDISGTLVGFYSTRHEGVFTHKGQHIHVHFISDDRTVNGHLDGMLHKGQVTARLPAANH